jgi:hypothetical protein
VHVVDGRVNVHNVAPPDVKVTVPVDTPGSPFSARTDVEPYGVLAGVALAVKVVGMSQTTAACSLVSRANPGGV